MTPESSVLSGCLNYLTRIGIFHWRNSTGAVRIGPGRFMRFGKVGSSDILGCLPSGRFLAVECKSKNGRLLPEQKQFLDDITHLGGLAVVAHSFQELDTALREAGFVSDPLFEGRGFE